MRHRAGLPRRSGRRCGPPRDDLGIGSLAVIQEGGYARTYGAVGTVSTLLGLLGRPNAVEDPIAYLPDEGDAHGRVAAARAAWEPRGRPA